MNNFMIGKLFQKDWHAIKPGLYGCLAMGYIGLIMFLLGGFYGGYLGAVILDIAVIVLMQAIVTPVLVQERKEQTLAFLLSLPISNVEYTLAKVLVGLGTYFLAWLLLYVSAVAVILIRIDITANIIPYFTVLYVSALMFYCLVFATGLVTESERWTMLVFALGNVTVQVSIGLGMTVKSIRDSFTAGWNETIVGVLTIEAAVIVLSLALMVSFQSRKRDFL